MSVSPIDYQVIADLQPGDTVWDTVVKGFGVRMQRRTPVYVFKYTFRGRQRFKTIGPEGEKWFPDSARTEAARLQSILTDGERPRDPASERDWNGLNPTFSQFAKRYLSDYATPRKKARSVAEDRRNLDLHILPDLGLLKLNEISRSDIARFHAAQNVRPTNANRCLALISHIFTIAEKWGLRQIGTNPCRGLDRYRERPRERFLNSEELGRLGHVLDAAAIGVARRRPDGLAGLQKAHAEDWRALYCLRLLILTGARLTEILSLQWQWVNWEHGYARLPDSKTGPKNLPLPDPALTLLRELEKKRQHDRNHSKHVFPGKRRDTYFTGVQKPWQRISTAAGLDDVRIHDLRHCYASVAVTGGESLYMVGTILGHRHSATTQRYAHLAVGPQVAAANRNASRLMAMMKSESAVEDGNSEGRSPQRSG
jgi:integrase